MVRQGVRTSLYAGLLMTALGAVTWATGEPFVFPSLGPTAFILAMVQRGERTTTYRVLGGHTIGAAAGLLAYTLLADGAVVTTVFPAFSHAGLRLAASGVVSLVLTTVGMIETGAIHSPACATTLIVSLGLMATVEETVIIVVSVAVLMAIHRLWQRVVPDGSLAASVPN